MNWQRFKDQYRWASFDCRVIVGVQPRDIRAIVETEVGPWQLWFAVWPFCWRWVCRRQGEFSILWVGPLHVGLRWPLSWVRKTVTESGVAA